MDMTDAIDEENDEEGADVNDAAEDTPDVPHDQVAILTRLGSLEREVRASRPRKTTVQSWAILILAVGATIVGIVREFSLKADLVDLAHVREEMDGRIRTVELKQAAEDETLRGIDRDLATQRGKLDDILTAVRRP